MSTPEAIAAALPKSLRTPLVIRVWRALRVVVHIVEGLAVIFFVFPSLDQDGRRRRIHGWCKRLLLLMNVRSVVRGLEPDALPGDLLIVANHISWLDIFVILSVHVTRFVGKAELRHWPVLRHLIEGTGTLLLDRTKRHDTARIIKTIADVLAAGDCVAIFPEGTTTDGRKVLQFHGSLLQPVIDAGGHIAPIAIRYRNALGEHSDSATYTGGMTIVESIWRVSGERELTVEVTLLPLISAKGQAQHRREMALAAQNAIAQTLNLPVGHAYGRKAKEG